MLCFFQMRLRFSNTSFNPPPTHAVIRKEYFTLRSTPSIQPKKIKSLTTTYHLYIKKYVLFETTEMFGIRKETGSSLVQVLIRCFPKWHPTASSQLWCSETDETRADTCTPCTLICLLQ